MELRPYQVAATEQIKDAWFARGHRRVLLHMAGGAGKTVIFSWLLQNLTVPGTMFVHGRKLVDQASARLFREGVDHGIYMNLSPLYRPSAQIQVCSIDTLVARARQGKTLPDAKVIVIDEAHMANSPGYTNILLRYPQALQLHVTATPYNEEGLDCDVVVKPISMMELIEEGYLVRPRYFPPHAPDVSRVGVIGGEFNQRQLGEAIDNGDLIDDVVARYQADGENRSALCFCVNVRHSKHMAERFNAAGIRAEHVDANTPDIERNKIMSLHESGQVRVLCSVGIHITGVDMPWLSCLIDAAPTWSYIRYVQKICRGTRIFENKKDFIVLDHSANLYRHGPIEMERDAVLRKDVGARVTKQKAAPSIKLCDNGPCYTYYRGSVCPACGSAKVTEIKFERQGTLKEIKTLSDEQLYIIELKREAKAKKYKRGWIFYSFKTRFGEESAKKYFPPRYVPDWVRAKLEGRAA